MEIARKTGIDQSSVSHWGTRFSQRAADVGLALAGKEFGVECEVQNLRSLAVEMHGAGLSSHDAREGLGIVKAFSKLGVDPGQHALLVKICQKVGDPDFVHAALTLGKIEKSTGIGYAEIVADLESSATQLPEAKKQLQSAKAKLADREGALVQTKQELADTELELQGKRKQAQAEVAKLKAALLSRMQELHVAAAEVEHVAKLKSELAKQGLDIPTLVKLAREFMHEWRED